MKIINLFLLCLLVSSCGWTNFRKQLGVGNEAPDEFLVEEKRDLTIPREFSLPVPGSGIEQTISKRDQAEEILFGGVSSGGESNSKLEQEFTKDANLPDNSNIRSVIEKDFREETSIFGTTKGSTLEKIVDPFGYNRAQPKIVDGTKENQRIRKSLQEGEKVSTDDVIVVEGW